MNIDVAKTAGFCFGVRRAVDAVEVLLASGKPVYTLGPIIHNPQVVERFAKRGVRIVESPAQVPPGETLVIRSHGVGETVYREAEALGVPVYDATCPFVAKIHRIVAEQSAQGRTVLIAGDPDHPEVQGIRGHCHGESHVFSTPEQLVALTKKIENIDKKSFALLSQTTFNAQIWEKCVEIAKKHYTNLFLFDTICNATANRQQEAAALSQSHDFMVIVGGKQSSNTAKLRDVCEAHCPTVLVETADELRREWFDGVSSVGLTAGASTPADIIKEVHATMSEIVNNEPEVVAGEPEVVTTAPETAAVQPETVNSEAVAEETAKAAEAVEETAEETVAEAAAPAEEAASEQPAEEQKPVKSFEEMSFEEALEASLNSLNTDEKVRGIVVGIAPNEVQVEVVGRKQAGYIPANELSADPNANPADVVKVGDELELLIMRTNDQEGTIMLSKKRVDAVKGWDTVVAASESGEILDGVVTDVIKGGLLAVTNGVRVFIPASQASAMRMEDLSPLLKTNVRFRIIEVNQSRRRAVGSIRAVAREERKEKEAAFWAQAEIGQKYTGVVKSMTSYGAFVDLGGVDGMIHISELSWSRIKNPSEVVSIGQTVDVYIKDLDHEKKKISLGYRKAEDNPWEIFKEKYPIGSVVTAKIVGMTTFGAFAQILPGVDGLIHISQIANRRIEKPQDELKMGQEVTVKITNVDYDNKRISLSIRALLEPETVAEGEDVSVAVAAPAEETAASEEVATEEAPAPEQVATEEAVADTPAEEASVQTTEE